MNKFELDTPCLVLDLDILEENLAKMQTEANAADKDLRPHAKTHKCSTLAKKQIDQGAIGICAAKVSEAEALVKAGVKNVLVTGPVAADQKAAGLVGLLRNCPSLMAVVDHPRNIELIERHLAKNDLRMDVLVDIDVGLQRTGVPPDRALELADLVLASNHIRLKGIQAYAGQVQHIHSYGERWDASIESMKGAAEVFRQLQAKYPYCTIFSGTGTGTYDIDLSVSELTELQVGSYALMDAEYMAIESAGHTDLAADFPPALTLLTTIVSASHNTHVTVDAGLKSLYRDGARPIVVTPEHMALGYDWFGDEYGMLSPKDKPKDQNHKAAVLPQLGTVLELVVSHCDPTVNQFDGYHIIRNGRVVDFWPIDLRGKSQ
jgi:D-serine deaminase-like pyridoxal phosphate-dependent protein